MATLPAPRTPGLCASRWSSSRRPLHVRRVKSTALVTLGCVVISMLLGILGSPAAAAPTDPPGEGAGDMAAGQSARDAAAAEVERIEQYVAQAEEELARLTVEAEAATDAARRAQAELATAQASADSAAAALQAATAEVNQARVEIADLGRESYMGTDAFGTTSALLDADGPAEFLQRAVTLDLLSDDRAERLAEFRVIEEQQVRAEAAAQDSVAERDEAARGAAEAEAAVQADVVRAQEAHNDAIAQQADYGRQLQQAEIELLRLQGVADPEWAWAQGINAENARTDAAIAANAAAAANGQAVPPTTGRITSCYGARWGAMHYGVDIAAPIGTPIYTPQAGRVLQAGPASGFGLAVYIQHDDGSITVYGHINDYFVSAGQQVSTGQQIAEVGNRGQSTGPHLHFEVHTGGLYRNRTDPMAWLAARGVSLGGGC